MINRVIRVVNDSLNATTTTHTYGIAMMIHDNLVFREYTAKPYGRYTYLLWMACIHSIYYAFMYIFSSQTIGKRNILYVRYTYTKVCKYIVQTCTMYYTMNVSKTHYNNYTLSRPRCFASGNILLCAMNTSTDTHHPTNTHCMCALTTRANALVPCDCAERVRARQPGTWSAR